MLNKAQVLQALTQRIQASGHALTCELCGSQAFMLADFHNMPMTVEPTEGIVIGAFMPFMPLTALVCEGCGNTKFVNLVMLERATLRDCHAMQPQAQTPPGPTSTTGTADRIIGQALNPNPPGAGV